MTIQERIRTLAPSVPEETLAIREKLTVARDVALVRVANWNEWPENLQTIHGLVAVWAGRAALSPWPKEDLEKMVEVARYLLTATLILRRQGEIYGSI